VAEDLSDLARPGPGAADDLPELVAAALGEPPGRLGLETEDADLAWLVRDGIRVCSLNPAAVAAADPARRSAFAEALAGLVRRYDGLRETLGGLEVGRTYRVDYKHEGLRRTFRVKAVLREVGPWRPAQGAEGGGFTLTLETRPRFGRPATFHLTTDVLTRIAPA
jgi:hypothetical protein